MSPDAIDNALAAVVGALPALIAELRRLRRIAAAAEPWRAPPEAWCGEHDIKLHEALTAGDAP